MDCFKQQHSICPRQYLPFSWILNIAECPWVLLQKAMEKYLLLESSGALFCISTCQEDERYVHLSTMSNHAWEFYGYIYLINWTTILPLAEAQPRTLSDVLSKRPKKLIFWC